MASSTASAPALQLRESFRLDEIGDVLGMGVTGIDASLNVRLWNRWMEEATGQSADHVVGRPLRDVFPDISPMLESAIRGALQGAPAVLSHRLHKCVFRMRAPSGYGQFQFMQQSGRVVPVQTLDGPLAVVIVENVTERVATEEDLRLAMERAEDANRAKAQFLAAMSHELRTPIGAVSGYADLMRDGLFGDVNTKQAETLDRIKAVSQHLLDIVEEVLVFARVEAGREAVHLEAIDARKLMADAAHAIEPSILQKGLMLDVRLPNEPLPIVTDVLKVRQILINLIGNAVKFTQRGSITARLDLLEGKRVRFEVSDTGEGIRDDQLESIFEPFVQADAGLSRRHSGTGLGLAVSRQFARLLGGDITVTSTVGVGSSFVTTLPLQSHAPELHQG